MTLISMEPLYMYGTSKEKFLPLAPSIVYTCLASADLEVQLVQLNHCDGVYSNY